MSPETGAEPPRSLDERLETMSALAEPLRRRLFLHVAQNREGVTRDEAAAAVGISRSLAAFHMDRLHAAGLLDVGFRARSDGAGRPSRGRPAKVYRVADREVAVSIPPRQYELAATLFADALAAIERPASLDRGAADHGRALGVTIRQRAGVRPDQPALIAQLEVMLADLGYAPRRSSGAGGDSTPLCLDNCPFDALAGRQRALVCPTNRALLDGMLEGAGIRALSTDLESRPGQCCVTLVPTGEVRAPSA